MANRRRKAETSDLPPYLWEVDHRGQKRLRFQRIDGSLTLIDSDVSRHSAVQAAIMYNNKHRPQLNTLSVIEKQRPQLHDDFNKPLKIWISEIIKKVESEEGLANGTLDKFRNQMDKLSRDLGERLTKTLTLEDMNKFIKNHFSQNKKTTYNDKINNLKKLFSYLADEGAIEVNFMKNKKLKRVTKLDKQKGRKNLTIHDYKLIYEAAPLFLKVAMSLSLQTTHAVREIYRIKHSITKPESGVCGIVWYDKAKKDDITKSPIYGILYIHRQKTYTNEASRVAIPVTQAIKETIDLSETSGLSCPYVVHRKPIQATRGIAKDCDHKFQVHHTKISKTFSKVRDELGLYSELPIKNRPSYHEIRGLAARLIESKGTEATKRMAHASRKATKSYTQEENNWHLDSPIDIQLD